MSYPRIKQVLRADPVFESLVATNDREVILRSGEKIALPSLVADVYAALKATGCNMQSVSRMMILAAAARLTSSTAPVAEPSVPVVSAPPPPPPPPVRKRAVEAAKSPPPSAPPQLKSTSKHVVVTTSRVGAAPALAAEKPVDTATIHRYQCAVASAQLLAALHQLFERDDFPGHDIRKKKLDDLITEVEQASSAFVNLSVRAILRAKATITPQQTAD